MSADCPELIWDCLDSYEYGYTQALQRNKAMQHELLKVRYQMLVMDISRRTLMKENEAIMQHNEELQRKLEDQDCHLQVMQRNVDACRTDPTLSPCCEMNKVREDSNRINYFADAINDQRDSYNNLRHAYERLQENFRRQEVATCTANAENRLLRQEVVDLSAVISSNASNAETILTSSFLQRYRDIVGRSLNPQKSATLCSSENFVDLLSGDAPFDMLRHRLLNADGRTFELFSCYLFECLGYRAHHRGGACDLGIDFELRDKDPAKTWVGVGQCKRYNRKIGSQDVRAFTGSMLSSGCHTGFFLTTSSFTRDAEMARSKSLEKNINIELWDFATLCDKIWTGGYAKVLLQKLDDLATADRNNELHSNYMSSVKARNDEKIWEPRYSKTGLANAIGSSSAETNWNDRDSNKTGGEFDDDSEKDESDIDESDMHLSDLTNAVASLRMGAVKDEPRTPPPTSHVRHMPGPVSCSGATGLDTPCSSTSLHTPQKPIPFQLLTPSTAARSASDQQSTPMTPLSMSSKKTKIGAFREREHDRWCDEETEALALLVHRFRGPSGSIGWAKMSAWLFENEEKRAAGEQFESCALNVAHFDKEKLRCRWKNYDAKKFVDSEIHV